MLGLQCLAQIFRCDCGRMVKARGVFQQIQRGTGIAIGVSRQEADAVIVDINIGERRRRER